MTQRGHRRDQTSTGAQVRTTPTTAYSVSAVSAGLQSDGTPRAADGHDVHRVRVFAVVALALLMMSSDSTIVATALHAIQHGMDTTVNWAGWTARCQGRQG